MDRTEFLLLPFIAALLSMVVIASGVRAHDGSSSSVVIVVLRAGCTMQLMYCNTMQIRIILVVFLLLALNARFGFE